MDITEVGGYISDIKEAIQSAIGEAETKEGEIDVRVESTSRVRSWVTAKQHYKIGGLDDEMQLAAESKDAVVASWKSFLDLGGWNGKGGKRPDNDSRKKDKGPQS